MKRLPMSQAAAGLYRQVLARSGQPRDRILLTNFSSQDWQSLTFVGERHEFTIDIVGPEAEGIAERMTDGLSDAEFTIAGHIVVDILAQVIGGSGRSVQLRMEALTIEA